MNKYVVLFNPLAGSKSAARTAREIRKVVDGEIEYIGMTDSFSYQDTFSRYPVGTKFVLCGGDGTINRFINKVEEDKIPDEIYYFAGGSGNDFGKDIGYKIGDAPVNIKKYLSNLPTVTINGKNRKFINGIGYGIDGWCCEVADIQRRKNPNVKVNYTKIALSGLLGKYKPAKCKLTIDDKVYEYDHVLMSPVMNGRFFGGGLMPTPMQDRLHNETLSIMIYLCYSRIMSLFRFPSIKKGTQFKYKKVAFHLHGKHVIVEYDRPIAAQIDGETVLGVTKIEVNVCEKYRNHEN